MVRVFKLTSGEAEIQPPNQGLTIRPQGAQGEIAKVGQIRAYDMIIIVLIFARFYIK